MSEKELQLAPLSDAIIIALSKLVDDAQTERREPSHSELEFAIQQTGLTKFDPKSSGQNVGKAKRVRAVLSAALEDSPMAGEKFGEKLVSLVRGCGGFRETSPNFVGTDTISTLIDAYRAEGYLLTQTGELLPPVMDNLSGVELTRALAGYVRRAKRGAVDAALLVGTGKDLLEATAAHVLTTCFGKYFSNDNFPTLLGQAFIALDMTTSASPQKSGESPIVKLERSLFDAGCSVNSLRNKQGTGHGRPWISTVTDEQARTAAEVMGVVSEYLLVGLQKRSKSKAA